MQKMKEMDDTHSQSSLSRSFGARIQDVLACMQHFIGSVTICIQCSPEITSLIIGGVNCILLVSPGIRG